MSRQFRSTFSGLFILPVLRLPPLARLERYLKARRERRRAGEIQAPEVVEHAMVEKMPLSARPSALRSSIRGSRCPSLRLKDGVSGGGPAVVFREVEGEQRVGVGFGRASCRTVPCIVNTEPTVQLDGTPSDPSVSQASASQVSPSPNSSPLSTSSRHLRHSGGGGGGGGGSNALRIENNTASCCTSGFVSELVSIPIPEEPADMSSPTADGAIDLITSNSQCFWPAVNFAPSNHQPLKSTTSLTVPAHR